MHLRALAISNFRAIEEVRLEALPATVVVAGPNGCGKSCLLDAIRIWKAAYGGYNENEFQQALSEFGINTSRLDRELPNLFRDRTKPIVIQATVTLADAEKNYIRENANRLVAGVRRRQRIGDAQGVGPGGRSRALMRVHSGQLDEADELKRSVDELIGHIDEETFSGEFRITPDLGFEKTPHPVLELIYSFFVPENIGVFEYHSAQRYYQQREEISNVDLRIEVAAEQQGQQALFNWAAKYQSVKTQLVGSYVRELIARSAGADIPQKESLVESLIELFRLFFPDKQFLGPQPTKDGKLTLNVRTASGKEHDITDLSSGEKEVLYGYLRLRNLAPRNSVLLLDEPELHLNPRLIRGLPGFYHNHLGAVFSNQVWLVTHSDVLLEEALDLPGFAVYHMVAAESSGEQGNQLFAVTNESLERAIIDLVGEKAAYRPGGKLVIFEGGGDSDFDLNLTCDLFPELRAKVNPISGTNRSRVVELRRLIEKANAAFRNPPGIYSITDKDSSPIENPVPGRELAWDVYHIENYLMDARYVLLAMKDALRERFSLNTEEEVEHALREAAHAAAEGIIRTRAMSWVNQELYACIKIGADPTGKKLADSLHASATSSASRIQERISATLTPDLVQQKIEQYTKEVRANLNSESWRSDLPGRMILRRFVEAYGGGLSYEVLRNLIIARMRTEGYQPAGMRKIVSAILNG